MRYLLDTNTCVEVLRDGNPGVVTTFQSYPPAEMVVASIVRAELMYGALRSQQPTHNQQLVVDFAAPLGIVFFDNDAADAYGRIRADLERAGRPVGPNDTLVAAIALSRDLIVVTHNLSEFSRVDGLKVEDWYT